MRSCRGSRGFTLIEVIVAISLLSVLVVATLAAMRTLGNTKATLDTVTTRVDEIRTVSDLLRNSINAALPVVRVGVPRVGQETMDFNYGTYFYGEESQLLWVAPFVAGANLGGVFIMHLAHVEDRLELRWHPYLRDAREVDWSAIEPRVLVRDVTSFTAGYLTMYGQEWVSEWLGEQQNPLAVRLTVQTEERFWPELVMNLRGARMNLR